MVLVVVVMMLIVVVVVLVVVVMVLIVVLVVVVLVVTFAMFVIHEPTISIIKGARFLGVTTVKREVLTIRVNLMMETVACCLIAMPTSIIIVRARVFLTTAVCPC